MKCPNCKCEIADDAVVCEFCGKEFEKKKRKKFERKAKPKPERPAEPAEAEDITAGRSQDVAASDKRFRLIIAAVITLVLVAVIIIIILMISDVSGLKNAKELAEYINKPILTARNKTDIYLSDESSYNGLNTLTKFDWVAESDKDVEVDGVKYPSWAVLIDLNDQDKIAAVTYADFSVLKKNRKGVKTDEEIDLGKIPTGEKFRKVKDQIDIDPFAIVYGDSTETYIYRYYFINNYDDEQAMALSVVFDSDNNYMFSTSQMENSSLL